MTSNPFTSLESTILAPSKLPTSTAITTQTVNIVNGTTTNICNKSSIKNCIKSNKSIKNSIISVSPNNRTPQQPTSQLHLQQNNNILRLKNGNTIQLFDNESISSTLSRKNKENDQLAAIIKTLLYFESRLKNDQKNIQKILYEKDEIINRQLNEIMCIKKRFSDTTAVETKVDEVAQYCPKCRKNYYLVENQECGIQTATDDKLFFRDRKVSPSQSIEFVSSSEEPEGQYPFASNTFASARRSKKYMSKRTSGTFRDYLKNKQAASSDPASSDHTEADSVNKTNIDSEENQTNSDVSNDVSYSHKILNLHGIKATENHGKTSPPKMRERMISPKFNDDFTVKENGFEITDDWYASASDVEDSDNNLTKPYGYNAVNPVLECVNQILLQQSMDGLLDANNSKNENSNSNSSGTYEHVQKNQTLPRAKRVHFSTQNSMVQVPRNKSPPPPPPSSTSTYITMPPQPKHVEAKNPTYDMQSIYSNEYEPIGSHHSSNYYIDMESKTSQDDIKRSTGKIERSNTPPDLPPKPPNLMKFRKSKFIAPLKSNPITSASSNQSEPDYCSISEINEIVKTTTVQIEAEVHKSCDDYSSAGGNDDSPSVYNQVNEVELPEGTKEFDEESFSDIPKLPNVAEIISPTKSKESFQRFISQDNYITKSPLKEFNEENLINKEIVTTASSSADKKSVKNILNEINTTKKSMMPPTPSTQPPKLIKMSSITENNENINIITDKTQIQAEFDWYNLDAEYGKSNQPDVIQMRENEPESELFMKLFDNCSDTSSNRNGGGGDNVIENYNLDEEFSLVSQPDIVNTNTSNQSTVVNVCNYTNSLTRNNFSRNVNNFFNPINGETPKLYRRNSATNYETFLTDSGLSSKPIVARRKKLYYSEPFV